MSKEILTAGIALEYHVMYNHYPQPLRQVVYLCQEAIRLWNDGLHTATLKLEDYELESPAPDHSGYVSITSILDDYRLWEFVNQEED